MKNTAFFTNGRGQKLYTVEWTPDTPATAALVWLHGLQEYIDRWDHAFEKFAAAGIAVYGYDAHGHGKSEPFAAKEKAYVHSFSHLVDDGVAFLGEVEKKLAAQPVRLPLFVAGNSLGGLVASHVVLKVPQDKLAGLIMQSPALDVEWTPVLRVQAMVGDLLANVIPKAAIVPAVRPEDMSQDPKVVEHYLQDPNIIHGNVKARTGNEILKGFKALSKVRKQFTLPMYAVHGTTDRTTCLGAVQKHIKEVASTDATLVEIKGGYHELFMGPEKDEVFNGVLTWINKHSSAPAASEANPAFAACQATDEAPATVADAAPAVESTATTVVSVPTAEPTVATLSDATAAEAPKEAA